MIKLISNEIKKIDQNQHINYMNLHYFFPFYIHICTFFFVQESKPNNKKKERIRNMHQID